MARDIEAAVKIKDDSASGLSSVERNVRESGKRIKKETDSFGLDAGKGMSDGIKRAAPGIISSVAGTLGNAAKQGGIVTVAAIAGIAPVIASITGAAITGGVTTGGIIGGVAVAARDARVQAAGKAMGANLLAGLQDRAGSFIGPILQSIDLIEAKFAESGDTIESIFKGASRFVVPLVDAVTEAFQAIARGVDNVIGNAGPVMEAFSQGIIATGATIEHVLTLLSENGTANADALRTIFTALNATILAVGYSIKFVIDALGFLNNLLPDPPVKKSLQQIDEQGRRTGSGQFALAQQFQFTSDAAEAEAEALKLAEKSLLDNARAAKEALSANRSLFDSMTSAGAAVDSANAALKKNGQTLDSNTAKGRANRAALSDLAGSFNNVRSGMESTGASSRRLDGALVSQRAQFIKVATAMTGSARSARQLADQLLGIPTKRQTTVTMDKSQASRQAKNLREEISQIKGKSVTITATVNVNASRLAAVENRLSRIAGFAGAASNGGGFALNSGGDGARTGGAVAVQNHVYLDGVPFYSYTEQVVADSNRRNAFRNKVGARTP